MKYKCIELSDISEYEDNDSCKAKYTIMQLQQENKQLKDNWNKLKKWVNKHYNYYMNNEDYIGGRLCFTDMKNKIQELEKSDKQ